MLHIRTVSPRGVSTEVVEVLAADPGVFNLIVLPGAVRNPDGDLINSPNLFSIVVAVLAGLVGVISLTESRANTLIGVFISVTTIPAAADIGVSTALHSRSEAVGSLEQLLLNVGVLIVVGALALRLQRQIWKRLAKRTAIVPPGV